MRAIYKWCLLLLNRVSPHVSVLQLFDHDFNFIATEGDILAEQRRKLDCVCLYNRKRCQNKSVNPNLLY